MERPSARRYEGKVALVTASTAGIGLGIARRLGLEGAKVVICSRKQDGVDKALQELRAEGIEVSGMACHVGDAKQQEALVDFTVKTYGGLDVLVSNAAVNPFAGSLLDMPASAIDKIFDINGGLGFFCGGRGWQAAVCCEGPRAGPARGTGPAHTPASRQTSSCAGPAKPTLMTLTPPSTPPMPLAAVKAALILTQLAVKHMRRGGSIMFISSVSAYTSPAPIAMYGISKTALLALTMGLAQELGPQGIRVNCVAPGAPAMAATSGSGGLSDWATVHGAAQYTPRGGVWHAAGSVWPCTSSVVRGRVVTPATDRCLTTPTPRHPPPPTPPTSPTPPHPPRHGANQVCQLSGGGPGAGTQAGGCHVAQAAGQGGGHGGGRRLPLLPRRRLRHG